MRFAGSRISDFMSSGPDMGKISMNHDTRGTEFTMASNEMQSEIGAAGIGAAAEVESAGIMADAQAGLANAQGNAAMMSSLGDMAGSALGAFKPPAAATSGTGFSGAPQLTSGINYDWNL